MKGWLFLALTIAFEVSGTTCMRLSEGFRKPLPSALLFVFYGCALTTMTVAMRELEMAIVYAVWSGVGTAVVTAIGIWAFGESMSALKFASLALIVIGVLGLNLASPPKPPPVSDMPTTPLSDS